LLKPHFSYVYKLETPILTYKRKPVQQQHYEDSLGQIAKYVIDSWDFISTYAEVENNRITLITRDLERAMKFSTNTTKVIKSVEFEEKEVILGVRFLIEGSLLKYTCDDPNFVQVADFVRDLGYYLLKPYKTIVIDDLIKRFYTRDDFYKHLQNGGFVQQGEFTTQNLLSRFPNMFQDLASISSISTELRLHSFNVLL